MQFQMNQKVTRVILSVKLTIFQYTQVCKPIPFACIATRVSQKVKPILVYDRRKESNTSRAFVCDLRLWFFCRSRTTNALFDMRRFDDRCHSLMLTLCVYIGISFRKINIYIFFFLSWRSAFFLFLLWFKSIAREREICSSMNLQKWGWDIYSCF